MKINYLKKNKHTLPNNSFKFHNLDEAFIKLGFKDQIIDKNFISLHRQEEALFNIFYLSKIFMPEKLWQDINHIQSITDKEEIFISILNALKISGGLQDNYSQFKAVELRQNFAKIKLKDEWTDLILYISQHAFNRETNMERNEIINCNWIEQYKEEYLSEAKIFGLINRISPRYSEYDAAWILGADRAEIIMRLIDYNYISSKNVKIKNEDISFLTGQRESWAEIDGLSSFEKHTFQSQLIINFDEIDFVSSKDSQHEILEEGKEFLFNLAQIYNIQLNPAQPFITYIANNSEEGRVKGRTYANYGAGEKRKITETLVVDYLLKTYLPNAKIIDASFTGQRPTTASTVKAAASELIEKIQAGSFNEVKLIKILLQTNNPYILRQSIITQEIVNNMLKQYNLHLQGYKVEIDGVGFSFKSDIPTLHSEIAALIAEKWKNAYSDVEGGESYLKHLLYQTRNKNEVYKPMPTWDKYEISIIGEEL